MRGAWASLVLLSLAASACLEPRVGESGCNVIGKGGAGPGGWSGDGEPGEPGQDSTAEICGTLFVFQDATDSIVVESVGNRPMTWEAASIQTTQRDVRVWLRTGSNSSSASLTPGKFYSLSNFSNATIKQGDAIGFCTDRIVVGLPLTLHFEGPRGGTAGTGIRTVDTCEPVLHGLEACDELNFYRTVPYSTAGLGPFKPVPADATGRTMNRLYTALICAQTAGSLSTSTQVTAIFSLVNVEPLKHPSMRLPNAVGYQLLLSMTTSNAELLHDWAPFGVKTANASVSLAFSGQTGTPKSQAHLKVASTLHAMTADSVMAGSSAAGKQGQLGLYTFSEVRPFLHAVDFSDYTYYGRGAATIQPGSMGVPANAVPAYHNVAFNVLFTLADPPYG